MAGSFNSLRNFSLVFGANSGFGTSDNFTSLAKIFFQSGNVFIVWIGLLPTERTVFLNFYFAWFSIHIKMGYHQDLYLPKASLICRKELVARLFSSYRKFLNRHQKPSVMRLYQLVA